MKNVNIKYAVGYFNGDSIPGIVIGYDTSLRLSRVFTNSEDLLDYIFSSNIEIYGWCFEFPSEITSKMFVTRTNRIDYSFSHESSPGYQGLYSGFGSGSVIHKPEEILELFDLFVKQLEKL